MARNPSSSAARAVSASDSGVAWGPPLPIETSRVVRQNSYTLPLLRGERPPLSYAGCRTPRRLLVTRTRTRRRRALRLRPAAQRLNEGAMYNQRCAWALGWCRWSVRLQRVAS